MTATLSVLIQAVVFLAVAFVLLAMVIALLLIVTGPKRAQRRALPLTWTDADIDAEYAALCKND